MIELSDVYYTYPSGRQVFNDLSLTLPSGHIYGLLGMNGAGKSTLLYLICSLLRAQKGTITVNGKDVSRRNADVLGDIFIVPEEYDLPNITLNEYVKVNQPFYPKFDKEALRRLVTAFRLPYEANLGQLSMGQKKKVYMCFALATGVSTILLDEPTNGMDIPSKAIFREIIRGSVTDGRTILISTHQVRDVEKLLDQVVIIDHSRILLNDSMENIRLSMGYTDANTDLEEVFNKVLADTEGRVG